MKFLKQDRPKKVKEIYRALKRDHPDMPAEMKARIAARQGKPGKQRQGPPYDAPIKPWSDKNASLHKQAYDAGYSSYHANQYPQTPETPQQMSSWVRSLILKANTPPPPPPKTQTGGVTNVMGVRG